MAGPLGRCENIRCFAITVSILALGIYSMYVYRMGILTTMEKRYNLSSKESGFSISSFEIGHLVFIFLLTYYGRNMHYPRVLGIAAISTVLAGVALSSLHFFYALDLKDYHVASNQSDGSVSYGDMCTPLQVQLKNHSTLEGGTCGRDDADSVRRYPAVYVTMVITMIIMGAALVPVNTFAVAYLDANVPDKSQAPIYIGMVTAFTSSGSFLGFFIAGLTARIYINPEDEWPSPDDSRWLGAWWIGNFALSFLALVAVAPMLMFPKSMKEPEEENIHVKEAVEHKDAKDKAKAIMEEGLGMFVGAKKLCTNPVFVAACFGYTSDAYIWSGLMPYLPKYLESQYRQSSWVSSLLAATMSGLAVGAGNFVGGIVTSKIKTRRMLSRFMLATNILSIIGLMGVIAITCDIPYLEKDGSKSCNSDCSCIMSDFTPVCGSDGVDYITPCYAGCSDPLSSYTENSSLVDAKNYTSCSCLPNGFATKGKCATDCYLLPLYGVFLFLAVALGDCNTPANICIVLGTVEEDLRSFALGIFNAVLSFLAFVPGPTIFGAVVDTLCSAWQVDDCGHRGSCLAYDVPKLRYAIHGLTSAFKLVGTGCYLYMVIKFRNEKEPLPDTTENGKSTEELQEMLPKPVET